jgi:hypothetical protein
MPLRSADTQCYQVLEPMRQVEVHAACRSAGLCHHLPQLLTSQHMPSNRAMCRWYTTRCNHHMRAPAVQISLASSSAGSHRRPQQPQLDGPFLLAPDQPSLRCQHISSLLLLRDSGQAPGAYDGPASKDATSCLARAPTPKVCRPPCNTCGGYAAAGGFDP